MYIVDAVDCCVSKDIGDIATTLDKLDSCEDSLSLFMTVMEQEFLSAADCRCLAAIACEMRTAIAQIKQQIVKQNSVARKSYLERY